MQINIEKKHFWIITSLIVMMIGALVLAANVSPGDPSAEAFGHKGAQIEGGGCTWNGYDRILIKPTDFITMDDGGWHIQNEGGSVHATGNRDLIANYVIPKGCKIPINGIIVSMDQDCDGATIFRNRITNTAAVNEGEEDMISSAEDGKYYDIVVGPDKDMKWGHNEKYISIKIRDKGDTEKCDVQGGYIKLEQE